MKKLWICFVLVCAMLFSMVFSCAEIDLSGMSLEELLSLQEELTVAIEEAQKAPESDDAKAEDQAVELDTSGYSELAKGSKGDEVKALQTRLFDLGFYSIAIDGDYGNGTVNAIKAFEEFNGLEQTGIATPEFQAFLFSDNAKAKPVSVSSVKFDSQNQSMVVGKSLNVAELVAVLPENATEQGVAFSVDNDELATIDENGILEAKARGNVTVTVTPTSAACRFLDLPPGFANPFDRGLPTRFR